MTSSRRLQQLVRALTQLERALAQPKSDYLRDSAIQRFEFTSDLAWKTLQDLLEHDHGLRPNSPKNALRLAFENRLVPDLAPWFALIDDRNLTSHTYDIELAEKIYARLPAHAALVHALVDRLQRDAQDVQPSQS
jgi:nucleotidyltransferase substrate binding protein (TIGR01987 family)